MKDENEAAAYHSLATELAGDREALTRSKTAYGSWRTAANAAGLEAKMAASWQALRAVDIELFLYEDPLYPPLLREIPHPPHAIYALGALRDTSQTTSIAIIGTRKATAEGRSLARRFGSYFARAGVSVVSGLALGIDASAHTGALEANGRTIAVLACGLDTIYPADHGSLARKILRSGGALISEYPPGSRPYQSRFLERNRIVSGLCKAVVVIEAPHRSGALATARFGLEQNRDIFATPGPATHPNYAGSHRLIRSGAMLVTAPEEVLLDLGLEQETRKTSDPEGPEETAVVNALKKRGKALTIDELAAAAVLSPSEANRTLTMLILRGTVREEGGKYLL